MRWKEKEVQVPPKVELSEESTIIVYLNLNIFLLFLSIFLDLIFLFFCFCFYFVFIFHGCMPIACLSYKRCIDIRVELFTN